MPEDEQWPITIDRFEASPHVFFFVPTIRIRLRSSVNFTAKVNVTVRLESGALYPLFTENPYGRGGDPALATGSWAERRMRSNAEVTGFWLGRTVRGPDLSSENGLFTFRLTLTDPFGTQYGAESQATIDWLGPRVECIVKADPASPFQGIQSFGGRNKQGFNWRLSREQLIAKVRGGETFYVENPAGRRAELVIAHADNGVEYLRTLADGVGSDNLLSLRDCEPDERSHERLLPGGSLAPQQELMSHSGAFTLAYQRDGNLVLYKNDPFHAFRRSIWASGTKGVPPGTCVMQSDGNLVIYGSAGEYAWDSESDGNPGSRLIVQDDGNAVIYRPDGVPVYATNTVQLPLDLPERDSPRDFILERAKDGCLELFAGRHVAYQLGPNSGWSDWRPLPNDRALPFRPGPRLDPPPPAPPGNLGFKYGFRIARNLDGRYECFIIDEKKAVSHIWQVEPGGAWYSTWVRMTRPLNNLLDGVYPVLNGFGCLQIIVVGFGIANSLGGNCWHRSQLSPGGDWGEWSELGGLNPQLGESAAAAGHEAPWIRTLEVANNQDGRLELFGRGPGLLFQNYETRIGGDWAGWIEIKHWPV